MKALARPRPFDSAGLETDEFLARAAAGEAVFARISHRSWLRDSVVVANQQLLAALVLDPRAEQPGKGSWQNWRRDVPRPIERAAPVVAASAPAAPRFELNPIA